MKQSIIKATLPVAFMLFALLLKANTLRVPADYPTVQAAIDAANEGDTVLVSPGLYKENLQLRGRNIVLSSRFMLEKNPTLIDQTIIDGSHPVHADTASCLLIWKHETSATIIQGFTFQGGSGTVWLDPAGYGTFREGGGILTEFASPVIRYNVIRDNAIRAAGGAKLVSVGGGGIRAGEGAPLIENNVIMHNRGDGYGGGIVLNYCPGAIVRNNIIAHNYGGENYSGGGFWASGADQNTVITLQNNVIAYNETPAAASQYGGKGGGIWIFSVALKSRNNIVWGNKQAFGKQIGNSGALLDMQYNCVQDGYEGAGNITADPLFVDTVCYMLNVCSPCIDGGSPDQDLNDFSWNGRSAAFPARGSLRGDIGVYGGLGRGVLTCFNLLEALHTFSKVLDSPVVRTPGDSRSVNWIDIDGDHDLDLFISNGPKAGENNFLYKNNGRGQFTAVTDDPIVEDGEASDGATWADIDNDGDPDCFVVNWYNHNNMLFLNNGNGRFQRVKTGDLVNDGGYSETASWGDYDRDGKLDLYVTNSEGDLKNFLYRGNGDGTFTKITSGAAVNDAMVSRCVSWVDFDDDGDDDLFVANEQDQDENLYRNNGDCSFTKITTSDLLHAGGKTMSASWGDYDNDGRQDVFLANDQGNNALFHNDGKGRFTKVVGNPVVTGSGHSFGSAWADVDNDGDLDLFVTNSFGGGTWRNFLFRNNGAGGFTRDTLDIVTLDLGWSYGCAFGDMDRDGDLDLAVATCYHADQSDYLYENHASETANHWLEIECIGSKSNRSAIGTKVRVKAVINGVEVEQMREISAQTGYCGQNQLAPHFGLGNAETIKSIRIQWPSGRKQVFRNIAVDQFLQIVEGKELKGM